MALPALDSPKWQSSVAAFALGAKSALSSILALVLFGTFIGVMLQGLVQTYIIFDGSLSSWWTKIVIGALLFVFIVLQRLVFSASSVRAGGFWKLKHE